MKCFTYKIDYSCCGHFGIKWGLGAWQGATDPCAVCLCKILSADVGEGSFIAQQCNLIPKWLQYEYSPFSFHQELPYSFVFFFSNICLTLLLPREQHLMRGLPYFWMDQLAHISAVIIMDYLVWYKFEPPWIWYFF